MNPQQLLKNKIEKDAMEYYMAEKPSTRKYESHHYIQEDYCAGAQSLVPLVESLSGTLISIAENPNVGIWHDGSSEAFAKEALSKFDSFVKVE